MDVTAIRPEAEESGLGLHPVLSKARHVDELPSYVVPDTDLEMGASLGNSSCWVTTKGTGDIETVFSTYLGQKVLGAICVRYSGIGRRLQRPFQEGGVRPEHDGAQRHDGHIQLYSQEPGRFEIHPAFQRHEYTLPGDIQVDETVFVPSVTTPMKAREYLEMESPVIYQVVRLRNRAAIPIQLQVYGYAQMQGATPADLSATYDPSLGQGGLVVRNQSHPDWVRIFGVSGLQVRVARWETGFDDREIYETTNVSQLHNDTSASGAILGALQVDVNLQPGESTQFAFMTIFSHEGESKARQIFNATLDYNYALKKTVDYYNRMAEVSQVMTPDPQINLGVTWAKVNMLRVMANYPTGPAFTNDPSLSSAVVGRDACWFSTGCDFLLPEFSRAMLESLAARQRDDGLIVEYYNAVTDEWAYNGFNINDNTPLFIWAAWHHYQITKNEEFLQRIYPAVWKAGQCILKALDTNLDEIPPERKHGLVTCTVRGVETLGIAGWRNIIPNYTINGAVTEINAECALALRLAAPALAEARGTQESQADARVFREAGEALTAAINTHLINPETGLYYLNIDLDGNIHTDVTADEIYPVLFEVAPEEVAFRVISRLNSPDFWTTAGIRTVSRMSPNYDPYRQWGLVGGVWPGVAWWYAYAARKYHPEFMVQALRMSFEHYARDPKKNNTVPGQFSEWMDGESLVNRGMRLSPWEPPRFVLAAIRGILGLTVSAGKLTFDPLIPADWRWGGIRRFPYQGREAAFFATRQSDSIHIYGIGDFETPRASQHLFTEDVTTRVSTRNPLVQHIAFKKPGEILVCLGSSASQTMLFPLRLDKLLERGKTYQAEVYHSEWNRWVTGETGPGEEMEESGIQINAGGYRLLRFREQGA